MRGAIVAIAFLVLGAGCAGPTSDRDQDDGFDGEVEETLEDRVGDTRNGKPTTGAVAGTVRNVNGAALADAQIIVLGRSGTTVTGADGGFEIEDVAPGAHTLRVDRAQYTSLERDINVVAGKVTRLNITLADRVAGGDPGFREHLHDRWRGAQEITLFSGTVEHEHAYPPQGADNLPCVRGFGLNTGAGSDCYAVPLRLESGTIVPVGTERITVAVDWDKTEFVGEVRLRYQTANSSEPQISAPLPPGASIDIPVTSGMADHGHQLNTLWRFFLVAEPQAGVVVVVSQHFNEQFVGSFDVTLTAHKGVVPPEPPHPRYWAEGDTVVLADAIAHKVTGFTGVPRTRDPTATSCAETLPCFVLPDTTVVPAGTTRLIVTLEYEAGTPALEPYLSRKTLGMRTAAVAPDIATLDDLRVDPPMHIEAGLTVYELALAEGEADPFYQPRSTWLFLVAHEGEERGPTFTEDCSGVIVGCGGTTYRLTVVAINDNWTPELAGEA